MAKTESDVPSRSIAFVLVDEFGRKRASGSSSGECQGRAQLGLAENVGHAFQVVDDDGQAHLRLCPSATSQKKTRMAEDGVFQSGEGMFDGRSTQPRGLRRSSLLHALERLVVQVPRHHGCVPKVQRGFSTQVWQTSGCAW